ncbi:MAG TPA: sensor domain-containing diguanylate cyclase [Thermoanaerobaculia bacterium]|jgi:diguanylate cyclase (GGDEF)-like protein
MNHTPTRISMIFAAVAAAVAGWYDWPLGAVAIALLAIVNDRLLRRVEELQQRSRQLTLLTEMSELLQLSTTFDEAADILPPYAQRLFPAFDGALYVVGTSAGSLERAASWGDVELAPRFAATDCWALRRAHAHVISADTTELACRHNNFSPTAVVCVPMLAGGEAIGVLTLRARDLTRVHDEIELFARAFADQIALALANLRLQETLRTRAVRDSLTGLFNRRCMEETLQRASRGDTRIGVIVADVDHFKQYNDTWGHAGGDALLQQLARLMQRVFGEEDVVCRFGGDEFVIVMPDTNFDLLRASSERLVEESRRMQVHLDGQLLGAITLSAGIALAPGHATTVDGLIAAADRALYAAKSGGRDRVGTPPHQVVGLDAA